MAWEVLTAPWHRSWLSPQLKRNLSLFNIASMYKWYKAFVWTLLFWGMFPETVLRRVSITGPQRVLESDISWQRCFFKAVCLPNTDANQSFSWIIAHHFHPNLPPPQGLHVNHPRTWSVKGSEPPLWPSAQRSVLVRKVPCCGFGFGWTIGSLKPPTMMTTMTMIMMMGARMHQRLMIRINS